MIKFYSTHVSCYSVDDICEEECDRFLYTENTRRFRRLNNEIAILRFHLKSVRAQNERLANKIATQNAYIIDYSKGTRNEYR